MSLELPDQPPSTDEVAGSEDGMRLLAGFLVRRHADRAHSVTERGTTVLHLHFKH